MRLIYGALLAAWCLLIFWLSSRPAIPAPLIFDQQDKVFHATAYATMAWLCWRCGQVPPAWPAGPLAIAALLFCSSYGLSDEWHQSFVAGRDASFFDWLADTAGALLMLSGLYVRQLADRSSSS